MASEKKTLDVELADRYFAAPRDEKLQTVEEVVRVAVRRSAEIAKNAVGASRHEIAAEILAQIRE